MSGLEDMAAMDVAAMTGLLLLIGALAGALGGALLLGWRRSALENDWSGEEQAARDYADYQVQLNSPATDSVDARRDTRLLLEVLKGLREDISHVSQHWEFEGVPPNVVDEAWKAASPGLDALLEGVGEAEGAALSGLALAGLTGPPMAFKAWTYFYYRKRAGLPELLAMLDGEGNPVVRGVTDRGDEKKALRKLAAFLKTSLAAGDIVVESALVVLEEPEASVAWDALSAASIAAGLPLPDSRLAKLTGHGAIEVKKALELLKVKKAKPTLGRVLFGRG